MATLALAAVGSAVGGALLPGGVSLLGLSLSGATIGAQVGALAGSFVDRALAPGGARVVEGPRLSDLRVMTASEGAPIPRLYGRARLGGQLIWATDFQEEVVDSQAGGAGKGRRSGASAATRITYRYLTNFAVGLCEGPVSGIGRVWADGQPLDLSAVTWRLHKGAETQQPDSLIAARMGAGNAPAYRGVAYVVFEHLDLTAFGNRIPQLSFEVWRAVGDLEARIRSVTLIPGGGEFVYAPTPVSRRLNAASAVSENVHTRQGRTDFAVALDQMQAALPNVRNVSLVVGWFGTDLRAEHCRLLPGVDSLDKVSEPLAWSVAGLSRAQAHRVSSKDGRAAYGGTPADGTVTAAIVHLRGRGLGVTFAPFVFMDVPAGNALPDPYSDALSQGAYPWRGRITVTPAPGRPNSPDNSPAAADVVARFVGSARPEHFAVHEGQVVYSGPDEWSYRRFVLHQAALCKAAGGVDAFLIGSELRGLTRVRSDRLAYPFVDALIALAADVKSMLGGATRVTYAADWSEYSGHAPQPGDMVFNLDPLWASPHIDAVGIDVYWPLADWREGVAHADARAGASSIYDLDYLRGNIRGGEGFDWYYASHDDRLRQKRTPIPDAAGEAWIWRFKDIEGWWGNLHRHRLDGRDSAEPTPWRPRSKPFWFTELGCPAVDKGANEPNVFVDAKSAESKLPHFSRGFRDDFMQRRYLQAFLTAFDPAHPGSAARNPVSPLTGSRMVDPERITVYTWDARPWPAFPDDTETWGDGDNWRLGHWLNGRVCNAPVDAAVAALLRDFGYTAFDVSACIGAVAGVVVDRIMSAREALQPLQLAAFLDVRESGGRLVFSTRGLSAAVASLRPEDLVEIAQEAPLLHRTRTQEWDLPAAAKLTYISGAGDYPSAVEEARRAAGAATRVSRADLALVLDPEQAARTAEAWLFESWSSRESARFALPPSRLALEPGDIVALEDAAHRQELRVVEIGEHGTRDVSAISVDPRLYASGAPASRRHVGVDRGAAPATAPLVYLLDLPLLSPDDSATSAYVAAALAPWPGAVAIYRSPTTSGFTLEGMASAPATTGRTLDPLPPGVSGRLMAGDLRVELERGGLTSATGLGLLSGANLAAVRTPDGAWEVLQFQQAELIDRSIYRLRSFLRGQGGTEDAMRTTVPAGAPFVLLDAAIARVDVGLDGIGLVQTWRCGPASLSIGDAAYVSLSHAFRGRGQRPLSPAHLRGRRAGNGDAALTWIRRTRLGGDSWEGDDVPMGEAREAYAIDVVAPDGTTRTFTASAPGFAYTGAQQSADFGRLPPSLTFRIAQVSATAGRGPASAITL